MAGKLQSAPGMHPSGIISSKAAPKKDQAQVGLEPAGVASEQRTSSDGQDGAVQKQERRPTGQAMKAKPKVRDSEPAAKPDSKRQPGRKKVTFSTGNDAPAAGSKVATIPPASLDKPPAQVRSPKAGAGAIVIPTAALPQLEHAAPARHQKQDQTRDSTHTPKGVALAKPQIPKQRASAPGKEQQKKSKEEKGDVARDDHERASRAPAPGTQARAAGEGRAEANAGARKTDETADPQLIWLPPGMGETPREEKEARARYAERMRLKEGENARRPDSPASLATPLRTLAMLPGRPLSWSGGSVELSGVDSGDRSREPLGGAIRNNLPQPAPPRVGEAVNTPRGGRSAPPLPPLHQQQAQRTRLSVKPFVGSGTLDVELREGVHGWGGSALIRQGTVVLNGKILIVALKEFYSHIEEDDRELLRREVANVAKLASDNRCKYIMPYIGTTVHHDRTFLVSQYLTQGNMLNYLARSSNANRHKLIMQVATAVCFLHTQANLVHGDLKCENVLIKSTGDALLADFGLSTVIDKGESSSTTVTGIRNRNTLRFAAPEILLGPDEPEEDPRELRVRPRSKTRESDVYAFGMLILQAFTGKKPWAHIKDDMQVLKAVAFKGLVHPRPAKDDGMQEVISDPVWDICLRCWRSDPRKRPSIEWVKKNLQTYLD